MAPRTDTPGPPLTVPVCIRTLDKEYDKAPVKEKRGRDQIMRVSASRSIKIDEWHTNA
jgi:hypothetical protein